MSRWKAIVAGIALLLVLIVMVQNTQVITVRLLVWQMGMSQIVLIVMMAMIGFAIGYLVATIRTARKKAASGAKHPAGGRQ